MRGAERPAVTRAADGVEPDLAVFFREEEWLYRLARRLVRDDASARDLVQDVWAAALENPPRDDSHPRSWLKTVVHRIATKQRARLRPVLEENLEGRASEQSLPDDAAVRWESRSILRQAVDDLDERLRITVLLRYQEGLYQEAIARELAISERSVRNRLTSAHAKIRARLGTTAAADPRHDPALGSRRSDWAQVLVPLLSLEDLARLSRAVPAPLPIAVKAASVLVVAGAVTAAVASLSAAVGAGSDGEAVQLLDSPPEQAALGVDVPGGETGEGPRVAAAPGVEPPLQAPPSPLPPPASRDDATGGARGAEDREEAPATVASICGSVLLDGAVPAHFRAWLSAVAGGGELDRSSRMPLADDGTFEVGVRSAGMYHLYLDRPHEHLQPGDPSFLVRCRLGPDRPWPPVHIRARTGTVIVETADHEVVWLYRAEPEWEYVSAGRVVDGRAVFRQVPEGTVDIHLPGDVSREDFADQRQLGTATARAGETVIARLP